MDQPSSTESNAITLRIRFKSASLDDFIGRYGADVSPGGIFIRTKQPVEVGTTLQFEFSLADGSALLFGTGTVAWVRESDPARANNLPGMGLRFDKLTLESQHTHQVILAEKARKEGKASSTPYPPTAFVAPAARTSPPPEASKPDSEAEPKTEPKTEASPANLTTTQPELSAIKPAAPAEPPTASSIFESLSTSADADEFSEAGKTEVSDKPLDYYLKEVEAAKGVEEGKRQEVKTSEEAVPQSLLEDLSGAGAAEPITKSGPPPEGFGAAEPVAPVAAEEPAPSQPASPHRKSGSRESFVALMDLDSAGKQAGAPNASPAEEVLPELSAGVPIEETAPEKTEEVATTAAEPPVAAAAAAAEPAPEPALVPLDLGTGLETGLDDRPPSRDAIRTTKPKGSAKTIVAIAVVAAAVAFGAVYLAKTKPWEQAKTEPEVATPAAENPPAALATPPAKPEPAKPAAEPAVKQPAAEAPKVAAEPKPEKKEAEKPAEKKAPAGEKTEKPAAAKAEVESGKPVAKTGVKAGAKAEEPATSGEEEVYHVLVHSLPTAAEVLFDGEYFSRTPCDRRVLDPTKSFVIAIRKEGYEQYERLVGPSDNWVKKPSGERVLTVSATLRKAKHPAASSPQAPASEAGPAKKAEPAASKPERSRASESAPMPPPKEPAKAVAKETAKPEPAAARPEPAKPAAQPAAVPAAAAPAAAPKPKE